MVTKAISKKQKDRFKGATENLAELEKILAPFIRPRKIIDTSTQGQWQRASSEDTILTRESFQATLRKVARPVKSQSALEK